jgi:hypothetical protein
LKDAVENNDNRRLYNIASIGLVNYWAIPKCGNTFVKAFLLQKYQGLDALSLIPVESNNFVHREGMGFVYLSPNEALINGRHNIAFVRDPIERFKSLYIDFCVIRSNPGLPGFNGMTVDSCLLEIEHQFSAIPESAINPHLRSQRYFLEYFRGNIFRIDDFRQIRINVTDGSLALSEMQVQRVNRIYSGDFHLLNETTPIERFLGLFN